MYNSLIILGADNILRCEVYLVVNARKDANIMDDKTF